jgi:PAS domain S-box-containing protein
MKVRVNAVSPITIGLIGITISIFITLLIWSLATARKRALTLAGEMTKELIEERNRLNNIIEGTHVGTWVWHVQKGEVVLNDYWANIIGYELSELKPLSIATRLEHLHPDDAKISTDALEKHFSGELEYYECEVRMRHKDGHWV